EGWVIRLFLIAPEAFIPMRAGTGQQGILKHIDGRTELLPQSGAQRRFHRVFSHNVCSFLLLFSTCYHQKRSESTLIRPLFCSLCTDHIRQACYGEASTTPEPGGVSKPLTQSQRRRRKEPLANLVEVSQGKLGSEIHPLLWRREPFGLT